MSPRCKYFCEADSKALSPEQSIFVRTFFSIWLVLLLLALFLYHLYIYITSRRFHPVTRTPKEPYWMRLHPYETFKKTQHKFFTIYTKQYEICWDHQSRSKTMREKSKRMMKRIRKLLQNHFEVFVDVGVVPDSTCLISIPTKNFECGPIPGTFTSIHKGPPNESYYEYRMIGDDRIQVAYYVVGGVKYVAGVCVYFADPYQSPSRYRESIILKLLKSRVYWSNYNLQEETMEIIEKNNELTLITKNRYGESKEFRFDGDRRKFEDAQELSPYKYQDFKAKYRATNWMKIEICKLANQLVMIENRDGRRMHAVWNKKTKKIEYFKCRSCEEPEDSDPPSYQSCSPFHYVVK